MAILKGLSPEEHKRALPDDLILLGFRGSIAHGMYVPSTDPNSIDDKDVMGVFVGKPDHYMGMKTKEHHEAFVREWDCVSYEARKFIALLEKANPNVLSLLWMDRKHYIQVHPLGQRLIDNKGLFVSKKIYHSFTGYAYSQLHRMTHLAFQGYMGEKRKTLVEKHGYDTKNAAHLIRLLRMGIEFLNEGELHVDRQDAAQLLEIKRGEWTLERVKEESDRLFKRAEASYDECKLPHHPDHEGINKLCIEIIREYIHV